MNSIEFLSLLDDYFRGRLKPGDFIREVFDHIYDHPKSRPKEYNPIETFSSSTFKGYLNGKGIGELATSINSWLNPNKFKSYIEGLVSTALCEDICYDLRHIPDFDSKYELEPANIPDILTEQFVKIIHEAAENHKHYITKKDEIEKPLIKSEDVPLIEETINNECPLCAKNLFLKNNSKRNYCKYKIVRIYNERLWEKRDLFSEIERPKDEGDNSNKIALCSSCAERYEKNPTIDVYTTLKELKKTLVLLNATNNKLASLQLEEDINKVLFSLTNLNDQNELTDLDLNLHPLSVQDKIKGHPLLLFETKTQVIHYFNYIQNVYSDLDCMKTGSDEIASDIGKAYRRIKDDGFSQEDIVSILTEWIIKKSGHWSEKDKYRSAARIIVSYYIQSCQVFEKCDCQVK